MARVYKRDLIEARWGLPFWDVVRAFAEQGLNRGDTAKALGCSASYIYLLLAEYPEHDPFPRYGLVGSYIEDTGESFRSALERMIAAGMSVSAIATTMGFGRTDRLRYAMAARGIELTFPPPAPKPRKKRIYPPRPNRQRAKRTTPLKPYQSPAADHPWRKYKKRKDK